MSIVRIGLILGILLLCVSTQELDQSRCLYRYRGVVWDIGDLMQDTDYEIAGDQPHTKVSFNICKQVNQTCGDDSYAVLHKLEDCRSLTDYRNNPSTDRLGDDSLRLLYRYTGDKMCFDDPTKKHSFELRLICSEENGEPTFITNSDNPWMITIEWEHQSGCPIIKANALWQFFDKYRVYLAPSVILLGLFFLILGGHFIKTSVFFITFASIVFTLLAILYAFALSYKTPEWVGWIILTGSMVLGAVVALLTAAFVRVGVILIGIWAGATVGSLAYQTFAYLIASEVIMLWSLMAVFALIGAVLSIKLYKFILVIGTSIIGGFLFIRGIAFYAQGYPNEFELHNEIVSGELDNVPWTVYVYVVSMIICAILSFLWKQKKLKLLSRSKSEGYFDINS